MLKEFKSCDLTFNRFVMTFDIAHNYCLKKSIKPRIISHFVISLLNQAVTSAPGPASWKGYPHF